ncbi:MAG: M20/M25/M40 family metallo-hydrolase [Candidatus Liptonbacteria bacterium]|nr:M20/M25/M40 family metallo-hydrolase [Candidatus Liptonbacteria bacterium]
MNEHLEKNLLSDKIEQEKNLEALIGDLREFSSLDSFSGEEMAIRGRLKSILESLGMDCSVDDKGNLWAKSRDENQRRVLVCAHMDKVGRGEKAVLEKDRLRGRLDDALGLSIILQLIRKGLRPSVLFTVEEESEREVEQGGQTHLEARTLPDGVYNAGARYAAEKLAAETDKPKLIIVVDVTRMGNVGDGPIVYTSSGLKKPGKQFYFPAAMLKKIAKIIHPKKPGVSYAEGNANDSIEFTFVPDVGVLAVEIPVENNHTPHEEASIEDVEKSIEVLRSIVSNADQL